MEILTTLLTFILNDPSHSSMVALLMLITCGALYMMYKKDGDHQKDIKDLIDQFQKQSEENQKDLMEIIEKYQEGQINVIQAINEIKILLATIGAKL